MPDTTHSIDSALQDNITSTLSINSALQKGTNKTISVNSVLSKAKTKSFRLDAAIMDEIDGYVTGTQCLLRYMNKDPNTVTKIAKYITDINDLESNVYKHIYKVYLVGDYGDNQCTLYWTKFPDYSSWNTLATKEQDVTYGDTIVWRNLGQTKRMAFSVEWNGDSNITHEAIEVFYNIKTQ